jgi:glycosyltransferase involved in cell wall biosynthesis
VKILRITDLGYGGGGVETGIIATNEILRNHGHDVRVVASNFRPDINHYSDYEFSAIPKGAKKLIYVAFNVNAYATIRRALDDFNPDIVLIHTLHQATAAPLFLLNKYPTILFVHGPEVFTKTLLPWHLLKSDYKHESYKVSDLTFFGRLHYWYFRCICGPLYKLGLRNINQVIAVSNYTLRFLHQEGFDAKYIPNGVKLRQPRGIINATNPALLSVGRLEKYKGIDDLIRAMPAVLESVPSAQLKIVGDGPFAAELKDLIKKLHLQESVKLLGYVDDKELDRLYADSTVFVMPSTWPETFGKVGVEAMSVGRPVIATDVGGVRDWLKDGENGLLVPPHRPDQLADRITELLKDKRKASRLAKSAQISAKKFSIEQMASNIETLCNRSLKHEA